MPISEARTEWQLEGARALMRDFVRWHYTRHHEYRHLIDTYFDPAKFEAELAALPGDFAAPRGRLLVAEEDGAVAGCVALRDLGDGACEMKRMFVDSAFQGRGIGLALAEAIVSAGREIGYRIMRLDTGPKQVEAQQLYQRLGFRRVEPYYDPGAQMRDWLVFMERDLQAG